jgi:hypothetical protein
MNGGMKITRRIGKNLFSFKPLIYNCLTRNASELDNTTNKDREDYCSEISRKNVLTLEMGTLTLCCPKAITGGLVLTAAQPDARLLVACRR